MSDLLTMYSAEDLPSLDDLERFKLMVEIRKLTAEAEQAELVLHEQWEATEASDALDSQNRVFNFFGDVSPSNVAKAILTFNQWHRRFPGEEFTLVFNSPGGSVIDGFALYDALLDVKSKGHKLTTVVRGWAASMGSILLQAGDERIIGPHADVMIHEVSSEIRGTASTIRNDLAWIDSMQDRALDILSARSALSRDEIREQWRMDWVIGAKEAVKLGFADTIG